MTLPKPNTATQEVLYELITNRKTSIETFFWMCGFRTRISELVNKFGISIFSTPETKQNKFGRSYTYKVHNLSNDNRQKAIDLYFELWQKSR